MPGPSPPNHPRLESVSSFLQRAGIEDAGLTVTYQRVLTPCDCPMDPHHRWNCALTPIWAQTIRDQDCNPWTVTRSAMWVFEDILINRRKGSQ